MVLEWREREHEQMDQAAFQSPPTIQALRNSGLYKFFCTSPMRANVRILEFLVNYWDHDLGMFNIEGETLEITTQDIYFITGLSHRGAPVNLEGTGRSGDPLSVQNYVDVFCRPGTQKKGSSIHIADIQDFTLQVLTSTVVRLSGTAGLHHATRTQMRVAVDCFRGTLHDWCSGIAPLMKRQLSDCRRGRRKNFGYASILVAFFFERVPAMSPAIPLEIRHPRQPRLSRWGDIFLRHGGGDVVQSMYDDDFYTWWERQVPALEQFPYAGLDFRGDPDLVLPPGGAWGEMGKSF